MRKMLPAIAAVAICSVAVSPAPAYDVKSKHAFAHHHRHTGEFRVQPFSASPRAMDHKDPTRPGGRDPSFNPPPT